MGRATPFSIVLCLVLAVVSARSIVNHAESASRSDSSDDDGRSDEVLNPSPLWLDKGKREVVPDVAITGTARAVPDVDVAIQSHSDHDENEHPPFPDGNDVDSRDESHRSDITASHSMESSDESDSDSRHSRELSDESDDDDDDSRQKRAHDGISHSGTSGSDSNSRLRRQADDLSDGEDDDSDSRQIRSASNDDDNSAGASDDDDHSTSRQRRNDGDDSADSHQKSEVNDSGDDVEDDDSDEERQRGTTGPLEPPTIGVQP